MSKHDMLSLSLRQLKHAAAMLFIGLLSFSVPDAELCAAESLGKVVAVSGKEVTIVVDTPASVRVGSRVEIFVVLPEIDQEASVATGRVSKVNDRQIVATIDEATGEVDLDPAALREPEIRSFAHDADAQLVAIQTDGVVRPVARSGVIFVARLDVRADAAKP